MQSLAYCPKCDRPQPIEVLRHAIERLIVDEISEDVGMEVGALIESYPSSIVKFACAECDYVYLDEYGDPIAEPQDMLPFIVRSSHVSDSFMDGIYHPAMR